MISSKILNKLLSIILFVTVVTTGCAIKTHKVKISKVSHAMAYDPLITIFDEKVSRGAKMSEIVDEIQSLSTKDHRLKPLNSIGYQHNLVSGRITVRWEWSEDSFRSGCFWLNGENGQIMTPQEPCAALVLEIDKHTNEFLRVENLIKLILNSKVKSATYVGIYPPKRFELFK